MQLGSLLTTGDVCKVGNKRIGWKSIKEARQNVCSLERLNQDNQAKGIHSR